MAQLKDLIVTGPSRFLNDLYALTIYEGGVKLEDKYYLASNPSGYISDLSTAINGLSPGSSPSQPGDYLVSQYAGGSQTSYHRRPVYLVAQGVLGYTTSGKNYAIAMDSSTHKLYVNVPWTDTNTTYTLSGALSSHKFTSTLTAGGSGSGTSTSALELVAGSNITLTDDTTNKKITIAATDTTYSAGTGISINNHRQINAIRPVPVCDTNGYVLTWDNEDECTWSDPSTLYSAGVGLSKSSTTFSLDPAFGVEFIIGTQTAQTGSWTGVSKQAALYDGMQIAYWLPFAGSGNATLNLTLSGGGTTGAVNCYYNGTTRLTTHYGAGNLVHLTYRTNVTIGSSTYTGWWSNANYDTNNGSYFNRYIYSDSYVSGTIGAFVYTLLMERANGTLDSIVTSSSNGTSKARNTNGFRLPRVLYWGTTSVAANTTLATHGLYEAYADCIDLRYSFNITTSGLTARKPIYLVGALGSDGLFYLDSTWWTQTLPSSADGKLYIHIADAYDGYRAVLNYQKPIYKYVDGKVQEWSQGTEYAITATDASNILGGSNNQVLISNGTKGVWSNAPWGTGTVTSVRVQATSPIASSTSTAQSSTLNTTISLGYDSTLQVVSNKLSVKNAVPTGSSDNQVLYWDGAESMAPFWGDPIWLENPIFNAGEIIIGSSTGDPMALSKGSTGQVLTTTSSGNRVAWSNATVRMNANTGSTALSVLLAPSDVSNGASKEAQYANTSGKQLKFTPSTGNLSGVAQINGSAVPSSPKFTDTTYTFASGTGSTNGFTVTPAGGSATTYTIGSLICNQDTRDTNTTPDTYYASPNGALRFLGLKINSTIGIPTSVAGTYSGVLGLSPWSDSSGGHAWEFAFNQNGVYARHGTSSWSSWAQVSFGSSSGYRPIQVSGTAIPATDTLNFIAGSNISISTQQSGSSTTRLVIDCTLVPCVIEGTLIRMADGTDKPVEELQNGDEILSWDPNSNKLCTAIVVCVRNTGKDKEFVTHIFDDGSYLTVYGEHVVYNKTKGYPIDIAKFEPGDETINVNGETIVYAGSIRHYCRYERKAHYDVNSSNNLYFAGGVLNGKMQFAKFRAMQDVGIKLSPEVRAIYEEHKAENEKDLGYEQNEEYIKQIASDFKQRSILAKAIEKAKKNLADSDYIVQKYTEGLISAIDWLKAKSDRAGWRKIVNDDETALAEFDTRINDAKNRFASRRSKKRSRYLQQCRIDNIHLEDYRAMFKKSEEQGLNN